MLIPEEAELLVPRIHSAIASKTHLLTYAAPMTRKMLHFNDLTYYAIPALPTGWTAPIWLKIELGLLADRLYFAFEEYKPLLRYFVLDNAANDAPAMNRLAVAFGINGLGFLTEWLAIRRKGQDFTHTPMGFVCQGKKLEENHPFFAKGEEEVGEAVVNGTKGEEYVDSSQSIGDGGVGKGTDRGWKGQEEYMAAQLRSAKH